VTDIYISIDIETTGPAPGLYSMISLGAAAFERDGAELGTWSANLHELLDASRHTDTMRFWEQHPEAWALATENPMQPIDAMRSFEAWVARFGGEPIAAAWPAAFDFAFVNYYCHRFLGSNPLGFACLDIRSLAMGLTYSRGYYDLRDKQIEAIRQEVDTEGLRDHVAVDDAVEQGRLLVALLKRTKGGVPRELRP
jgi:DNA polymerase III alpha subunit (gram-positive type)